MNLNQLMKYIAVGSMFTSVSVLAATNSIHEQLQVPQCLAAKINTPYHVLAENKQFKIIDIPESEMNALVRLADEVRCGRFVNLSRHFKATGLVENQKTAQKILQKSQLKKRAQKDPAYEVKHQEEVNAALQHIVPDNIWDTLSYLTTFPNRSATQVTGVHAADWLKNKFESMSLESGRTDTTSFYVGTGWYKQPSLVTVIGTNIKAPAVVIGAHMDTLDGWMPGAGDDASGSATIMEMARVLLNSKTQLKHPIFIIWYAAEERGLVGSQYVVDYFRDNAIPVKAAIQFDMTGYRTNPKDPTMWVYTDYTNKSLSKFVAKLIDTYVHVPVAYSKCGYGCSDHASWDEVGVPAAFPCESSFENHNPYIHTTHDTISFMNLEHLTNFSKLALAFSIEMASE